jgi:hypothetical protein
MPSRRTGRKEDLFELAVDLRRRSGAYKLIDQFSKPIERGVLTKIRVRTRNRTTLQDE